MFKLCAVNKKVILYNSLRQKNTTRLPCQINAHQHGTEASSEKPQGIALSRGDNTSKIHLAIDSYGLPIEFIVTGGEVHDSKAANEQIDFLPHANFIIADKGYDSEAIRDKVREYSSTPVITKKEKFKGW